MASLFEMTVGQHSELLKRFAAGGMSQDDVKHILSLAEPAQTVSKMVFALRQTSFEGLFELPHVQVANMQTWNQVYGWGFSESEFPDPPQVFLPRTPSEALVLTPTFAPVEGLTAAQNTVQKIWAVIGHELDREGMLANPLQAVLHDVNVLPYRPARQARRRRTGLRWAVIDFAAAWGNADAAALQDAFGPDGAQAELLIALAHFPELVRAMAEVKPRVPSMFMGGWTIRDGPRSEVKVPFVGFDRPASIVERQERRLVLSYTSGEEGEWRASWQPTSTMLAPTIREL